MGFLLFSLAAGLAAVVLMPLNFFVSDQPAILPSLEPDAHGYSAMVRPMRSQMILLARITRLS